MNQQESGFDMQFPAVVGVLLKANLKVDTSGATKLDKKYKDDILFTSKRDACRCFLTADLFSCVEFNKVTQTGVRIVPGVRIPLSQKEELGQPKHFFNFKDVINYKVSTKRWTTRFIINTKGAYVIIMPIGWQTMHEASANKDLIQKCQLVYESMGIKVEGGPEYMADYTTVFAEFMKARFDEFVQSGQIKLLKDFRDTSCPKHKKIGMYYSQTNQYYCEKCKKYLG